MCLPASLLSRTLASPCFGCKPKATVVTKKTTIHIIPTNVKGLILLKYFFLKQLPSTLDDLPANAKQGENTLGGGGHFGHFHNMYVMYNFAKHVAFNWVSLLVFGLDILIFTKLMINNNFF